MNEITTLSDTPFDNPTLRAPGSPFDLPFYQTKETLGDIDTYSRFLKNAIRRFRGSVFYTNYKGFLISLGLDRSQLHGNITVDMSDIEMHHNILTIFDIAFIICEHALQTRGFICTNELVYLMEQEHKEHHIQVVMLDKTTHQLFHSTKGAFIHPDLCFGDWVTFINRYPFGLTRDICNKIIRYLEKTAQSKDSNFNNLMKLRDQIIDWSNKMEGY